MSENILSVKGVHKSFGGVHALKGVDLTIKKGEVHCLAGENGCGKSTIIKVISGVHKPDSGEVELNGKKYTSITPSEAIEAGVQIIYQDFSVFPNLTVMENLAINKALASKKKFINKKEFRRIAEEAVNKINFKVDLDALVEDLPVADKQLIAISRALLADAKLIIMDEPTTTLTKTEVKRLFEIIEDLKEQGVTILFVSHKLDEVYEICDSITIFRNGENVLSCQVSEMDDEKFAYYMTGRKFDSQNIKQNAKAGDSILEVKNLSAPGFDNVNFNLRKGEVLGISGQLGSGRTELSLALFGLLKPYEGSIVVDGKEVNITSPAKAQELGIALVPEDRLTEGLFLSQSIKRNINVTKLDELSSKLGVMNITALTDESKGWVKNIGVKTKDHEYPVQTLSGGNQQKVVLARWLATNPNVLILNAPTVGVDIGAKHDIHTLLRNLANEGRGIIVVSDDVKELVDVCDRVMVMQQGKIINEIASGDLNADMLSQYI
ncbi:sugar ABC transporter ATP-binding protein [Planomicrobium sp. CPCC 101110]|uniref:sugar ABC transporter ATP-binding protein n=1 Tax=Planomicrobium sp. CPCC 101110 TaxID=2599619 RepID=UPI0011B78A5C|nr:sugar ABC transporter ATP-binding protein [Planomicrobium sp. CPCC 101110]TWT25420.1 sugar ABC transporter ATP-binding protein [Planomicrobium sp. CPCC 101110]